MNKCKSYEVTTENRGIIECRCNGTKEREICTCGGDESKCDFYSEVREKATEKAYIMDAITFLNEKNRMCDYESQKGRNCEYCPIYVKILKYGPASCDDIGEKYPKEVVKIVQDWAHDNPEYPTWNEWLHYIYNYYRGFDNNLIFMDWINTRITKEEAEHWNIPYRKDIMTCEH